MRPEAAISVVKPKIDPHTKQSRSRQYAEFYAQDLGLEVIEGHNITQARAVRLPEICEPGMQLDLFVSFNGTVVACEREKGITTLFDTPVVLITDLMTVQLVRN